MCWGLGTGWGWPSRSRGSVLYIESRLAGPLYQNRKQIWTEVGVVRRTTAGREVPSWGFTMQLGMACVRVRLFGQQGQRCTVQ